jgi:N-acetylmuramoyl-L-alanine amidase
MTPADAALVARLTPAQRVGLTLYGECRGSSPALRCGIGSVIGNRVKARDARWGLSADAVCLKRGQFSCWSPLGGELNYTTVMAAVDLLLAGGPIGATLKTCLALGAEVAAAVLPDSVSGACFYYSPDAMRPRGRVPGWAVGLTPVAIIDRTLFFTGVA